MQLHSKLLIFDVIIHHHEIRTLNAIQQIRAGISSYKEAHAFIKQNSFYTFFLMPVVFNFLLFMFFSGMVWHYSVLGADYIYFNLGIADIDMGKAGFMKPFLHYVIGFLFKALGLVIYVLVFRYIVLILMAPVLTIVSERVEEILTGNEFPFEWMQFVKDTGRGILVAARNSAKEIFYTILIFFFSFVPLAGLLSPVLIFMVESYFYGFSMMDYTLERKKMNVSQSENFILKHKMLAITIGAVFNLLVIISTTFSVFPSFFISFLFKVLLLIPLVALSIAPIYGVVAGTLATLKLTTSTTEHE
jgi:CysZ protein